MAKKAPKSPILEALRSACHDERSAVEFMEARRWGDSPACPRCGDFDVYRMQARDGGRERNCRWRCRGCKRMHTVRTGTVMEESRLPVRVWVYCFWKACASKKGISALQLSRETEITHKSALFVMHRIRHAMGTQDETPPKLTGTVEVDETYVGGKPRYKGPHNKRGRGTKKTPVIGLVERGGNVRFRVMDRVTAAGLEQAIAEHVDTSARLITDELNAYNRAGRHFAGGHDKVHHGKREYVNKEDPTLHSNTVEGVFSLLKRGVYGTFHSVSKKHLGKYLGEFEFRHNTRGTNDAERVCRAILRADGKRLTYADHVGRAS